MALPKSRAINGAAGALAGLCKGCRLGSHILIFTALRFGEAQQGPANGRIVFGLQQGQELVAQAIAHKVLVVVR